MSTRVPSGSLSTSPETGLTSKNCFICDQHLLLGHPRHRIAGEPKSVEQRHHRLAAAAELGDEPREVVFQEGLAIGREHPDGGAAGGRIGGGKAEEQPLAVGAGEAVDAECDRAVLVLGERPRVDDLEDDMAVGAAT